MMMIPGFIGGLAIFNQEYKNRIFFSSIFANSTISLITRRLEAAGVLKLSLAVKTCIFMSLSSAISGLLKALAEDARQYQFFW